MDKQGEKVCKHLISKICISFEKHRSARYRILRIISGMFPYLKLKLNVLQVVTSLGGELVDDVHSCTHLVTDKVRRNISFNVVQLIYHGLEEFPCKLLGIFDSWQ